MWLAVLVGASAAVLCILFKWLFVTPRDKDELRRDSLPLARPSNLNTSSQRISSTGPDLPTLNEFEDMPNFELASRIMPFSLYCDALRDKSADRFVPSFNSPGTKYHVSLARQTCTCRDFVEIRHDCPLNHFSRWCKHMINVANDTQLFSESSQWHKAIAVEENGGPFSAFLISSPSTQEFVTTISSNREWINILVKTPLPGQVLPHLTGPIKQFGWNIREKRWSYGVAPRGAREMRKLLVQIEGMNEGLPLV